MSFRYLRRIEACGRAPRGENRRATMIFLIANRRSNRDCGPPVPRNEGKQSCD